jgi:hypothetical protein
VIPRRTPQPPAGDLLPYELTAFRGRGGEAFKKFNSAKSAWFRSHGIDPTDWSKVHPVLLAAKMAYGCATASDLQMRS